MTRSASSGRRVLDLFCGAGGAGYGYYLAGCDVTGVDSEPMPRYPFTFTRADALEILGDTEFLRTFALIHASPPCQAYSRLTARYRAAGKQYPDLIGPVRERLAASGVPYVIENVEAAPLAEPLLLCGTMFGLKVYRHRLFECSFPVSQPSHPAHLWSSDSRQWTSARTHIRPSEWIHGGEESQQAMGIGWMQGRDEIRQAIPPAFTRYIAESWESRQCAVCGCWWSPSRSHARTCSSRCRKALSRSRGRNVTGGTAAGAA